MPSYYNRVKGTLEVAKLAQSSDIHLIQSSIQDAISSLIVDMFGPAYILGQQEDDLKLVPTAIHVDQSNTYYDNEQQWISCYERYLRQNISINKSSIESIKVHMKNDSNLTIPVYAEIRDINFDFIQESNAILNPTDEDGYQEVEFNFNLHHLGVGHYYFVIKPIDISTADLIVNGDETEYDNISEDTFLIRYDRGGNYREGLEASYNGVDYLNAYLLEDQLENDDDFNIVLHENNFDLYFEQVFSSGNTYLITPGAAVVHGQKVYPIDTHVTIDGPSPLGDRTDLVTLSQEGILNVIKGKVYTGSLENNRPKSDNGLKIAYITTFKNGVSQWRCPICGNINDGNIKKCLKCNEGELSTSNKIPLVEQNDDNYITRQRDVLERLRRLEKKIDYQSEYNSPTRIKYICTTDPILTENTSTNYQGDGTYGMTTIKNSDGQSITIPQTDTNIIQLAWSIIKRTYTRSYIDSYTTTYSKNKKTVTTKYILDAMDVAIPYKKPKKMTSADYYILNFVYKDEYVNKTKTSSKTVNNTLKTTETTTTRNKGVSKADIKLTLKYGKKVVYENTHTTTSSGQIKIDIYKTFNFLKAGEYTMTATYTDVNKTKHKLATKITIYSGNFKSKLKENKQTFSVKQVVETQTASGKTPNYKNITYDIPDDIIAGNDSFYLDGVSVDTDNGKVYIDKMSNPNEKYITNTPLEKSKQYTSQEITYQISNNTKSLNSQYPVLNLVFEKDTFVHSLTPYINTFKNMKNFGIILFRNDEVFNLIQSKRVSYQKKLENDPVFENIYSSTLINIAPISTSKNGKRVLKEYHKFIVDKQIPEGTYSLLVYGQLESNQSEGAIYINEYETMRQIDKYGTSTKCLGSCNPSVIYLESNNVSSRSWDLVIEQQNDKYKDSGILISKPYSVGANIKSCTIDKNTNIPNGCSLSIQVSNDGGSNWITMDSEHITFPGLGTKFAWKLILKGNGEYSPELLFDETKKYAINFNIATEEYYVAYEDYQRCLETPLIDANYVTRLLLSDYTLQNRFSEWEFARIFMEDPDKTSKIDILTSNSSTSNIPATQKKDNWDRSIFFNQIFADLTLDDFKHTSVDYNNYDGNLEYDEHNYRFKYETDNNYNYQAGEVIATANDALKFTNYDSIDTSNFTVDNHLSDTYAYYGNDDEDSIYAGMHIETSPHYGNKYTPDNPDNDVIYYNSAEDATYDSQMIIAGVVFDNGFDITDNYTGLSVDIIPYIYGQDRPQNENGQNILPAGTLEIVVSLNEYGLVEDSTATYGKAYPIDVDLVSGEHNSISVQNIYDDFYGYQDVRCIGIRVRDITPTFEDDDHVTREITTTIRNDGTNGDSICIGNIVLGGYNVKHYFPTDSYKWIRGEVDGGVTKDSASVQNQQSCAYIEYAVGKNSAENQAPYRYGRYLLDPTATPSVSNTLNSQAIKVFNKNNTFVTSTSTNNANKAVLSNKKITTTINNQKYTSSLLSYPNMLFKFTNAETGYLFYIDTDFSLSPYDLIDIRYYMDTEQVEGGNASNNGATNINTWGGNTWQTNGQFKTGDIIVEFYDNRDHLNTEPIESFPLPAWGQVQTRAQQTDKVVSAWFKKRNGGRVKRIVLRRNNPTHDELYDIHLHIESIRMFNSKTMPALGPQLQMRIYPNNIDNLTNTKIRKFGVVYRLA